MFEPGAYGVESRVWSGRYRRHFHRAEGYDIGSQTADVASLAAHFGREMPRVVRRRGRVDSASTAYPSKNLLTMGALAGPAIVAHEFAHLLAPRSVDGYWHGPAWQAAYVECVAVLIGEFHAERLRLAFAVFEARKRA